MAGLANSVPAIEFCVIPTDITLRVELQNHPQRYPQYREMELRNLPVIAITIERVNDWGNLNA